MAKTIKTAYLPASIALELFLMLNKGRAYKAKYCGNPILVTEEPDRLTYPEGWYYAKGCLRNKHTSSTGGYEEVLLCYYDSQENLCHWEKVAKYCTLYE